MGLTTLYKKGEKPLTDFEQVYDLAKITMIDYRLDNLAIRDYDAFLTYFRSLLMRGKAKFTGCLASLKYVKDGDKYYFVEDLDDDVIDILADTVVLAWWEQNIQDVVVFQPHMSSKNFKQLQESTSLKQKSEYKDKLGEELSRKITEYQLKHMSELPFWGGN